MERWRSVSLFKAWTKPAGARGNGSVRLAAADLADEAQLHAAIALWEQADQDSSSICIAGTARWWQTRYLQHPQQPYQFHWLLAAGERRGLVVSKIFTAEGETRAHIVDHVLDEGQKPADLLAAFEDAFSGQAARFVHWPVDAAFNVALVEGGYQPDGFVTWFGLRALGGTKLDPKLLEASAWRLSMGFSDAF